eukprot:1637249-Rhodomonas_salina.1
MVQNAAKHVQAMDKWHNHPVIGHLQFKDHWTHSFLLRHGMRRKRVTADRKGTHPSDEEIRSTMERCQAIIRENQIAPKFTLNTDETGVFYGQGQRNQWVPEGQTKGGIRGTAAHSTMKNQFTANLTGSGEGNLLPEFLIIACTVGKPDMSRVKVIKSLHKEQGFTAEEGWEYKWWVKTLPVKQPKRKGEVDDLYVLTEFKLWYLVHKEKGTVVTCQKKAWMDTQGIC